MTDTDPTLTLSKQESPQKLAQGSWPPSRAHVLFPFLAYLYHNIRLSPSQCDAPRQHNAHLAGSSLTSAATILSFLLKSPEEGLQVPFPEKHQLMKGDESVTSTWKSRT